MRFNVDLPDDIHEKIKRIAFEESMRTKTNVSMAEIIRRAVKKYLGEVEK